LETYEKQYMILKEMKHKYKLAVKFYTETHNEEQLHIAYKEIGQFFEIYYIFKYYYNFAPQKMNREIFNLLSEEEKIIFMNGNMKTVIEAVRMNICEHIFYSGNYNTELYKYATEKLGYNPHVICHYQNKRINHTQIGKLTRIEGLDSLNSAASPSKTPSDKPTFDGSPMLTIMLAAISICVVFFHYYLFSFSNPLRF